MDANPEPQTQEQKTEIDLFRKEAARLRREFDAKIDAILERIREKKLKEIQERLRA